MKILSIFADPLFTGIILLQISMFGMMGRADDSLSINQVSARFSGATLTEDSILPPITAYNERGVREPIATGKHTATLILASDCTCESEQVGQWAKSATRRGDEVTVAIFTPPSKLSKLRPPGQNSVRLLSIRFNELDRLGLMGKRMPMAVRTSPTGIIRSIETL